MIVIMIMRVIFQGVRCGGFSAHRVVCLCEWLLASDVLLTFGGLGRTLVACSDQISGLHIDRRSRQHLAVRDL